MASRFRVEEHVSRLWMSDSWFVGPVDGWTGGGWMGADVTVSRKAGLEVRDVHAVSWT